MSSTSTGAPAVTAAAMLVAPAGSAPTTRTDGACFPSQVREPAISPPPPTGTTTASGERPSCAKASRSTVPCPAIVCGWSKAGTTVAPDCSAYRAAAAAASS